MKWGWGALTEIRDGRPKTRDRRGLEGLSASVHPRDTPLRACVAIADLVQFWAMSEIPKGDARNSNNPTGRCANLIWPETNAFGTKMQKAFLLS